LRSWGFSLFIIWPSIRRQTQLGERIDGLIDKANRKLDVSGQKATLSSFLGKEAGAGDEL
jgi:hypothetical protein